MGMSLERHFAQSLKVARKKASLTQTQLGTLCGLNRTFISMLERGVRKPSLESFMIIATQLKVPASTLLIDLEQRIEIAEQSKALAKSHLINK